MLPETANVPVGQGLGYPSFLEKASGNKIENTITLKSDHKKNNLLHAERGYRVY